MEEYMVKMSDYTKLEKELINLKAIEAQHRQINGELREENKKLKENLKDIKGIIEETNYLANKCEIVHRGDIELHGVINRLCLIERKMQELEKGDSNE